MKKKNVLKPIILFLILIALLMTTFACNESQASAATSSINNRELNYSKTAKNTLSEDFKSYWYKGEAEITSYKLEQARYGEMRNGEAVLVFVTEDFLPEVQVKADYNNKSNIPVLKLNATKKFNTGIYPYSIMQSTFFPVSNQAHALKISTSVQEWCGQVYAQLNNRANFEITAHSYFQGEADEAYTLSKSWTENEIWTKLRIDPNSLPTGTIKMVPSLEFTRLKHKKIEAYDAVAQLNKDNYTISYPDLRRAMTIHFSPEFPYEILGWEESTVSGYGPNKMTLTTKATKINSLKTAYWTKNKNSDEKLRFSLGLE